MNQILSGIKCGRMWLGRWAGRMEVGVGSSFTEAGLGKASPQKWYLSWPRTVQRSRIRAFESDRMASAKTLRWKWVEPRWLRHREQGAKWRPMRMEQQTGDPRQALDGHAVDPRYKWKPLESVEMKGDVVGSLFRKIPLAWRRRKQLSLASYPGKRWWGLH